MKLNTLGYLLTPSYMVRRYNRQVRYLYGTANRLKTCFYKYSTKIKNVLFRTYCSYMYACQLWNNVLSSSLKRKPEAYNNSFRFFCGLARYVLISDRERRS